MFLTKRFFIVSVLVTFIIASGYWWAPLFTVGKCLLWLLVICFAIEIIQIWLHRGITAERIVPERFSNGDDNDVKIHISSSYPYKVKLEVVDETPFVFQRRDISYKLPIKPNTGRTLIYQLRPVERGEYEFGHIRIFVSGLFGLVQRRFTLGDPQSVKVYPSYMMLRKYEILAACNRLSDMGIKKVRRVGNNTEFDQIKEYVRGDEYRSINWKASARRQQLMVNVYSQEKAQHIYNVIDKGRMMQQTFNGMTYLDYAINASLVLSFVAMNKEDKAGIITFHEKFDSLIPAASTNGQMEKIQEGLYRQETTFKESDYSALVANVNSKISHRSLMIVYTNFATVASMNRQLPHLLQLSRRHRVLVVFFEDSEIHEYVKQPIRSTEESYQHQVAEKSIEDQRLIVSFLQQHGILSLLTTSESLSVDVINKYLELKDRQMLG